MEFWLIISSSASVPSFCPLVPSNFWAIFYSRRWPSWIRWQTTLISVLRMWSWECEFETSLSWIMRLPSFCPLFSTISLSPHLILPVPLCPISPLYLCILSSFPQKNIPTMPLCSWPHDSLTSMCIPNKTLTFGYSKLTPLSERKHKTFLLCVWVTSLKMTVKDEDNK